MMNSTGRRLPARAATAILLWTSVSAVAAEIEQLGRVAPPRGTPCALLIEFDSSCCGPDPAALAAVTAFLRTEPGIRRVRQWYHGREGEQSFCVTTDNARATAKLEDALKALPPPRTLHRPGPRFRRDAPVE